MEESLRQLCADYDKVVIESDADPEGLLGMGYSAIIYSDSDEVMLGGWGQSVYEAILSLESMIEEHYE